MKFNPALLSGKLKKRYKRFFADIVIGNKTFVAHCPNSGSMMGLLQEKNGCWISKVNDPKRKLKYTLQIIEVDKNLVGVNTHLTNKIFLEALEKNKITQFKDISEIKPEFKFNENTRFDFMLINKKQKCMVEIKNVTLKRNSNIAEFPDAVTSRGKKHLRELINAQKQGYKSYLFFIVQREDCDLFKIAEDLDKEYFAEFNHAIKNGLNVHVYKCKITPNEIKVDKEIKLK